jgi:3-dehydro-L-gulonate 2-dehydrogenase
LNRFPLFIEYINKGLIKPDNKPTLVKSLHHIEQWDGNSGPGNLNAWYCMDKAIQLAKKYGSGTVALRNTNHWMRGGTYGIQAARENCIGICMTNTKPNMPPWEGRENRVGNNPLIIAVPSNPYPVLLDMAMSQFSYGKLEILSQKGEKLPFAGGYDRDLNPTNDPDEIITSELAIPAGYWKGSGLAIMVDAFVSLISNGLTTTDIGKMEDEHSLSQLFITFDLNQLINGSKRDQTIISILDSITHCTPADPGKQVKYPGQRTWERRQENLKNGIPVNRKTWRQINELI